MEKVNATDPTYTRLVGPGSYLNNIGVREFKYMQTTGSYAETHRSIANGIDAFLTTQGKDIRAEIWYDSSREFDRENIIDTIVPGKPSFQIINKLQKHLVSPSIVTGDVVRLDLLRVSDEEIPSAMLTSFNRMNMSSRRDETIEGYDQFYVFAGQLKLGRELAAVACGMCVTPYIKLYSSSSIRHLALRYQVANFAKKDRDDVSVWQRSIEESRARIGRAVINPLNGGLVNPR